MGLSPYTPSTTPVWPAANFLMYTGVGAGAPSRGLRRSTCCYQQFYYGAHAPMPQFVVTNNFTMGLAPLCPTTPNKKAQAPARASLVTVPSRGYHSLQEGRQGRPAGQGLPPIVVPPIA